MTRFILFILSRPIASIILFTGIAAGGVISSTSIPLDFLPRMEVPRITVATAFQGLPASDVRELITIPLEDALSGLNGLKRIRSFSRDGSSLIQLILKWGSSMDTAALQVREIIDVASVSLPGQSEKPLVLPVDPGEAPVILLGIFPRTGVNPSLIREMANREIRAALQQVEGVGSIQVSGGQQEYIEVKVDQSRLARTGLSLSVLSDTIGGMNAEYPSGSINDGDTRYIIKTDGRRQSVEEISRTGLVGNNAASLIRVQDVAQVQREPGKRQAFLITDGREGVAMLIRRNRGFSPVTLSRNLRTRIPDLNRTFSGDLQIQFIYDRSEEISSSIRRLFLSGIAGALAAFVVLWLYLRRLSYALITITAIPLSILGTILSLKFMGITFNIMSLGGLTLGLGMLVDNTVVVLENLVRKAHCSGNFSIAESTSEIASSTVGSTLTSIVVFLPLLFLPGLHGELFSDLAWAVILSLVFSFLVSITWGPLLFSKLNFKGASPLPDRPSKSVRLLFKKQLRHPGRWIFPAVMFMAAGVLIASGMSFRWLQPIHQSRIDVVVKHPSGTTIEHQFLTAGELVNYLKDESSIISVSVTGGGSLQDPYFLADPSRSRERMDLHVFLEPDSNWTPNLLQEDLQNRLGEGISVRAEYPRDLLSQVLNLSEGRIRLIVPGKDTESAVKLAMNIQSNTKGNEEIDIIQGNKKPLLRLQPDRQALHRYGLNPASLAGIVGTAVNGQVVSFLEETGRRIPIRVRLREEDRKNRRILEELSIRAAKDAVLKLGDVTTFIEHEDYPVLHREERRDVVRIEVPSHQAGKWLSQWKGHIIHPESELIQTQRKAFIHLILLAVGLLYILLGIQFNSSGLPIMLLCAQPLPLVGTVSLLWVTGLELTLSSLLGMLMVLGLSINNAILLYENYRRKRLKGMSPGLTIYLGTFECMRPIMITTCTSIAAMLPLALDFSGRNPQQGLALAVTGGLGAAIPAALFCLPALFYFYFTQQDHRL